MDPMEMARDIARGAANDKMVSIRLSLLMDLIETVDQLAGQLAEMEEKHGREDDTVHEHPRIRPVGGHEGR